MQKNVDQRIRFVDVARGLAVLLMIAVHATDAFLADVWRTGWLYYQISILYGFVAPVFIFFSGYTLYIALQRRKTTGRSSRDLALRAAGVLLLGYWLQIPSHSLRNALNASQLQIERFFDCNVLGVIGFSSLVILALHIGASNRRVWTAALGGLIIVATPFIAAIPDIAALPLPVRFYISPEGSFPIFPWTGYFCVGFGLAERMNIWSRHRAFIVRALCIGAALMIIGRGLGMIDYGILRSTEFWQHGPLLFLFRLGGIIMISAFAQGGVWWSNNTTTWLERVGRASLLVYVVHLMLIYGSPVTKGIKYWYGNVMDRTLGPLAIAGLTVAVTGAVWGGVLLWQKFRRQSPRAAHILVRTWWVAFLVFFLIF